MVCAHCKAIGESEVAKCVCNCKDLHLCGDHLRLHSKKNVDHVQFPLTPAMEATCKVHAGSDGSALTLYCNSDACKKPICALCSLHDHKQPEHDVMALTAARGLNAAAMDRDDLACEQGIADVVASRERFCDALRQLQAHHNSALSDIDNSHAHAVALVRSPA